MDELEIECGRAAAKAAGNFDYDGFNAATREKYDRIARAIIPIVRAAVLEEAAGVCDAAANEADEKLDASETEDGARNFASAHATSVVLAIAIRQLKDRQ